jgi:ATP-dependent DNA helicase RecQ
LQEDIINSVLSGKDTLALLPTGGGKSICYQVPAMSKDGLCIVITPLIALMKDQVEGLKRKGIPALAIFSGMTKNEIDITLDNCIYGNFKFLYISPERLHTSLFQERLKKMNVNLIAVDEAHCISQWGYDFRPSYLEISILRELLPNVPFLALTATATKTVKEDICDKLLFKNYNVYQKSFERKNLSYVVFQEEDKLRKMVDIISKVPGTGIVYVRSRKRTKDIAEYLIRNKIKADYYHAGLDNITRSTKQDAWIKGSTRIIVATNAFGMGIDKADVRVVVHYDLTDSPEAYYQEAGRAGRDEKKAYAVLLYNASDKLEAEKRAEIKYPELKEIKRTYQALANYYKLAVNSGEGVSFDFDLNDFCNTYNLETNTAFSSLELLERAGFISTSEGMFLPSRLHISMNNSELYEFQVKNPSYDNFIKILLRSYEGIFEDYKKIKESDLAKRANLEVNQVKQMLSSLDKMGILKYVPQKDKPQLTFTRPREDAEKLGIDYKEILERKNQQKKQLDYMIYYAEAKEQCRSKLLLAYFEDYSAGDCGICDYCLKRNKAEVSLDEFYTIKSKLLHFLKNKPSTARELITELRISNENKALLVIQNMLDNNEVQYKENNILTLAK